MILKRTFQKDVAIKPALARGESFRGRGIFFHDQMITPVLLNGKGRLPPRQAKAAVSYCFTQTVLPAGSKMGGSCRFGARVPMIVCIQTGCFAPGYKRNDSGTGVPLDFRLPAKNPSHPLLRTGWSLTRHLVEKKLPRPLNDPSPGPTRAWGQSEHIFENPSNRQGASVAQVDKIIFSIGFGQSV